eukprot:GHVS01032956.1.p1 GENE.GHVS01032956.1~~GHVS01032956.1.p1  ORF type:complete len:760 (+),score=214.70 GHVS01032956.1:117-2282(+)
MLRSFCFILQFSIVFLLLPSPLNAHIHLAPEFFHEGICRDKTSTMLSAGVELLLGLFVDSSPSTSPLFTNNSLMSSSSSSVSSFTSSGNLLHLGNTQQEDGLLWSSSVPDNTRTSPFGSTHPPYLLPPPPPLTIRQLSAAYPSDHTTTTPPHTQQEQHLCEHHHSSCTSSHSSSSTPSPPPLHSPPPSSPPRSSPPPSIYIADNISSSSSSFSSFGSSVVTSFSLTAITEFGDRTFFIAAIMSIKYPRILVLIATCLALFLMTILSTMVGQILHLLPTLTKAFSSLALDDWAAAVLLLVFAATHMYAALCDTNGGEMDTDETVEQQQTEYGEKAKEEDDGITSSSRVAGTPSTVDNTSSTSSTSASSATSSPPSILLKPPPRPPQPTPADSSSLVGSFDKHQQHLPHPSVCFTSTTLAASPYLHPSSGDVPSLLPSSSVPHLPDVSSRLSSKTSESSRRTKPHHRHSFSLHAITGGVGDVSTLRKSLIGTDEDSAVVEGENEEYEEAREAVERLQYLRLGAHPRVFPILRETFCVILVAELGDKSMISTIALSAAQNPYGVIVGGIFAHFVVTVIAIICGALLQKYISEKVANGIAGILFLLFGILTLYEAIINTHITPTGDLPAAATTAQQQHNPMRTLQLPSFPYNNHSTTTSPSTSGYYFPHTSTTSISEHLTSETTSCCSSIDHITRRGVADEEEDIITATVEVLSGGGLGISADIL